MMLAEAMWQLVLNLFRGYGEATVKLDKQHAFKNSNEKNISTTTKRDISRKVVGYILTGRFVAGIYLRPSKY